MTMHRSKVIAASLITGLGVLTVAALSPIARADDGQSFLQPDSLVISTSTYDRSRGAVASLTIGTTLPNSATATTPAIAHNDYINVWTNETVDASFGVTSPIALIDVDSHDGRPLRFIPVPSDQVVTSFSSKSELALHFVQDRRGSHLVFMGYAGANVGALDASNSDAVPGQDPTNPVTFAFGVQLRLPPHCRLPG